MSEIPELDRSSTDSMHWAEQFCEYKKRNKWSLDDIDEGLMVGWFANYWGAVHDPLATDNESLQAQVNELKANIGFFSGKEIQALGWMHAEACILMDRGEDIRQMEVPLMMDRAILDLGIETLEE